MDGVFKVIGPGVNCQGPDHEALGQAGPIVAPDVEVDMDHPVLVDEQLVELGAVLAVLGFGRGRDPQLEIQLPAPILPPGELAVECFDPRPREGATSIRRLELTTVQFRSTPP